MNVGDVATATGMSVKTLHYYEEIGLVVPKRQDNGYRVYSEIDVHKLNFIHRARGLGFSVDACRTLLSLYEDKQRASADVKAIANEHLEEIEIDWSSQEDLTSIVEKSIAEDFKEQCNLDVQKYFCNDPWCLAWKGKKYRMEQKNGGGGVLHFGNTSNYKELSPLARSIFSHDGERIELKYDCTVDDCTVEARFEDYEKAATLLMSHAIPDAIMKQIDDEFNANKINAIKFAKSIGKNLSANYTSYNTSLIYEK